MQLLREQEARGRDLLAVEAVRGCEVRPGASCSRSNCPALGPQAAWAGDKRTRLKVRGSQAVIYKQLGDRSQVTELHLASVSSSLNKEAISCSVSHDPASACAYLFLS